MREVAAQIRQPASWVNVGGDVTPLLATMVFGLRIVVIDDRNGAVYTIGDDSIGDDDGRSITLVYNGNHWDATETAPTTIVPTEIAPTTGDEPGQQSPPPPAASALVEDQSMDLDAPFTTGFEDTGQDAVADTYGVQLVAGQRSLLGAVLDSAGPLMWGEAPLTREVAENIFTHYQGRLSRDDPRHVASALQLTITVITRDGQIMTHEGGALHVIIAESATGGYLASRHAPADRTQAGDDSYTAEHAPTRAQPVADHERRLNRVWEAVRDAGEEGLKISMVTDMYDRSGYDSAPFEVPNALGAGYELVGDTWYTVEHARTAPLRRLRVTTHEGRLARAQQAVRDAGNDGLRVAEVTRAYDIGNYNARPFKVESALGAGYELVKGKWYYRPDSETGS